MREDIENFSRMGYHNIEDEFERLLTAPEICELLQIKRSYLYALTSAQKIPFIKIQGSLRFRRSAINEWLRAQETANGNKET